MSVAIRKNTTDKIMRSKWTGKRSRSRRRMREGGAIGEEGKEEQVKMRKSEK